MMKRFYNNQIGIKVKENLYDAIFCMTLNLYLIKSLKSYS